MIEPLPNSWKLTNQIEQAYLEVAQAVDDRERKGEVVYPPRGQRLRVLNELAPSEVKVVIIGQDPYHGAGQANGLAFSVAKGQAIPPSLRNIFKELSAEYPKLEFDHGDLAEWVHQGVLLLNHSLTVPHASANGHAKLGWGAFTDGLIASLSEGYQGVVFILWGGFAQQKKALIDTSKHLVQLRP